MFALLKPVSTTLDGRMNSIRPAPFLLTPPGTFASNDQPTARCSPVPSGWVSIYSETAMDKDIRGHLAELLAGRSAHVDIESALNDFPLDHMNDRIEGSPHTAWELLEHIRIAQSDILEFSRDPAHVSPPWPDGYCRIVRGRRRHGESPLNRSFEISRT